ncbi:uncharacterized protein LOC131849983 [Achroia grisella]|uniref:uncharacterized protein LOC131849983 n=1 Tax=Achroia grisella TaxID=688607 RepID=UPI0027D27845|nr:uncharacterized protein LOC131849983 [Achroia grisella]
MTGCYHIVPWYNKEEWNSVYHKIFITPNKEDALNLLQTWKARCPLLPSGIESTFILLQVQVQDEKISMDVEYDQFLRLAYSAAIMRFVNHMLDAETSKGSSLYHAAKNLGVPDWIIDLRHDTAHNSNLPSLELLREASIIGLNWLQANYWDKYKQYIEDYITGQKHSPNSDENQVAALIHFCISLSICAHRNSNIKTLSQIPVDMRESVICDATDLFGDLIDLSNLKTVSIKSLVNLMNVHCKKFLKGKNSGAYVNKVLLGEDSIFLSLDLLQYLGGNEFAHKNRFRACYVQYFELLLTFLHTNELLLEFILELVQTTQSNHCIEKKCHLAAIWLSEILKALRKCKNFVDRIKKNAMDISAKNKKDLKSIYNHWFPHDDNKLLLDLRKSPPLPLLDINFVKPIITAYNPYLTYFINDLLNLVEPPLPAPIKEKICKLANLISFPQKLSTSIPSKIYTVNDIKKQEDPTNTVMSYIDTDNLEQSLDIEMMDQENQELSKLGIWKLSSKEFDWSTCPIGQFL